MEEESVRRAQVRTSAELVALHESFEYSIRALALALDGCGDARGQLVSALEASARQFRSGRLSLAVTQGLDRELAGMANAAYRDCIARSMERLTEAVQRTGK
jgi:hypothetical protein